MSYIFKQQSNATFGSSSSDRVLGGLQLDEWEVLASCVIIDDKLGEGAFGEVYRGIVSGDSDSPRLNAYLQHKEKPFVAVKLLKGMLCIKYNTISECSRKKQQSSILY